MNTNLLNLNKEKSEYTLMEEFNVMQIQSKVEYKNQEWLRTQEGYLIRWDCKTTGEHYTGAVGYWCYNSSANSDSVKCPTPEIESLYYKKSYAT
jgi:hypothetical protein